MRPQKPREIAGRILEQHHAGRDYIDILLDNALVATIPPADRRFVQELVYGVVRWQAALDWLIARKASGRTQKSTIQILLRMGLYQLFWMDRVPDHAAIHEAVQMCREMGYGPQSGFVNALLRACAREREAILQALQDLRRERPATGWSHPEWLFTRWQSRWGNESAAKLLQLNNEPPALFARHNALRMDATQLIERWREENVSYDFRTFDWTGENLVFELRNAPSFPRLPSFREGGFYVQDPSTLLAVHVLDPKPGDRILDRCAAPGGKTTFIAQKMLNQGQIVAQDPDFARLLRVEENCQRLGVTIVETSRSDEVVFPELCAPFDRILLDVPCSNTGVLRRRADLRWRLRPAEIQRLAKVQLEILNQAAPLVKPGGTMVYSTCSLEPEENQEVVRAFMAQQPHFTAEIERELLPFRDGVDGAYVARLRRAAS